MDHRANVLPPVRKVPQRVMEKSVETQFNLPPEFLSLIDTLFAWSTLKDGVLKKIKHSSTLTEHLLNRDKVRNLAEAMVHTPFPQRAHRVLLLAHKVGCKLKQNAYECVAFQLAEKKHWHLIPSLVSLGKRQTGRSTVRLLNWHAQALLETHQYGLLDKFLEEFEQGNLKPNRKTFHLLTSAHIRNRCLTKARECLQIMEQSGFPVDASTHAIIVSVYRSLGPDSQVQTQALEGLRGVDGRTATTVLNSLMQLRIDAHDLPGALRVLSLFDQHQINPSLESESGESFIQDVGDDTPSPRKQPILTRDTYAGLGSVSPDAATFSVLINHMTNRRDLPRALRMLQRMMLGGIQPDAGIVVAIMRAHFIAGDEGTAISMVAHMCDSRIWFLFSPFIRIPVDKSSLPLIPTGIPLTIEILNTFLKGMLDSRGLHAAHVVLRIMRASRLKPDANTVEIFLAHLDQVEHVRPRVLMRALRRFTSTTVRPTLNHVNVILRSVLRREKYLVYGSGWNVTAANFSPERHDKAPYPENHVSGIAQSFDPTAGIELPTKLRYRTLMRPIIRSLVSRRVSSDRPSIALRIRHEAVTKSDMETAREVFRTMMTRGMHPNEYHFSALMEGYALSGNLPAAEGVMESAARAGIKPNVVMFTILIVGHARQGNPDLAMRTFQNMVATGVKPDIPAIDAVTSAYFAVGAYAMARRVLSTLWPYVRPFPKEMRAFTLKQLAHKFRSLHRRNDGNEVVMSKQTRLMLHQKLNDLIEAWTKLSGRPQLKRGFKKSIHPVSRTGSTSQKPGLI